MNAYCDIFAETDDYAAKARQIAKRQARAPMLARTASRPTAEAPLPQVVQNIPAPVRHSSMQEAILSRLTEPKSAKLIAAEIGRSERCIMGYLKCLKEAGYVTAREQKPQGQGKLPQLWTKGGTVLDTSGPKDRVLEIMARPMTREQIATATGLSKPYVSEIIRNLRTGGLVKLAGKAPKAERGPAADLWVSA